MTIKPIRTAVFKEGEKLSAFIARHIKRLPERSIIAVTSKIVSLSEKRTAVVKNAGDKERLIRKESQFAMPTKHVWLTIKDGLMMASAGIDESNGNGKLILLPKDSFRAAAFLRDRLRRKYKVKKLGVLITDSRVAPLRAGVTGVALGYAGFSGIRDYRGTPDIFGRRFHFSTSNMADGLSSAAVLCMGEGGERQPLAVITGAPVEFCDKISRKELRVEAKDDMYRPLFAEISSKLKKF